KIHRFKLDLAANTATELAPLRMHGSLQSLHLFDPERADGITAVTVGWDHDDDEAYTLTLPRAHGKPAKVKPFDGRIVDAGATGVVYAVFGNELRTLRGTQKQASFKLDRIGALVAVASDGARFATFVDNDIVVVDRDGKEQWRKPLWGTQQ